MSLSQPGTETEESVYGFYSHKRGQDTCIIGKKYKKIQDKEEKAELYKMLNIKERQETVKYDCDNAFFLFYIVKLPG